MLGTFAATIREFGIASLIFDVVLSSPRISAVQVGEVLADLSDQHVNNRLYGLLLALRYTLLSVSPDDKQILEIVSFVVEKCRELSLDLRDAGFPEKWEDNPIWDEKFSLDKSPMLAGSLLDWVETGSAAIVRRLLSVDKFYSADFPVEKRKQIKSPRQMLKSYRDYGVVIFFPLGDTTYYPNFQFVDGAVHPVVAEINQAMRHKCQETDQVRMAASMTQWWLAPNHALPEQGDGRALTPLSAVTQGTLTKDFDSSIFDAYQGVYGTR
ncbi:hypothetical protein [Corynebacterium lubricantis]|uniref:hypothetical protein n=1 Tax=Corynebacterium lubricantis TaxID=541095 RepID=UPI00036BB4A0|nr:hypothetical protein [Corynebacterium lubricantis]